MLLQEQLRQALSLASERSVALSKCESQLAEYRVRVNSLTKLLDEKNTSIDNSETQNENSINKEIQDEEKIVSDQSTSNEALETTVKTLKKIIKQKEETIERYQILLKEDRDKHSQAASSLQDEIKVNINLNLSIPIF